MPHDKFEKGTKLFIALLLILHIVVSALVIWKVNHINGKSSLEVDLTKQADLLKRKLDEIYDTLKRSVTADLPSQVESEYSSEQPTWDFLSLLKPVCQLSGLDFKDKQKKKQQRQDSRNSVLRHWAVSEGSERNLLWNGMTYEKGSLSVPAEGVYHVYCHVKFYVESNNPDDKIKLFEHNIFRYNAKSGLHELVIRNNISECKEGINGGAHLEYSSDIGSLVKLNAGDLLTVKVNDSTLLKHDRDWHNFGAYLI